MHNFDFVKPASVADAVAALAADNAKALSGGQTLLPTMKAMLAQPDVIVSLTGIAEMKGVCMADGGLSVGAATPHAVVAAEAGKYFPALAKLASGIGDPAVRSRGTFGPGNDDGHAHAQITLGAGQSFAGGKRQAHGSISIPPGCRN